MAKVNLNEIELRQHAALEVLELGQALFDAAIESALSQDGASEDGVVAEAYPIEELRAAAETFFAAVRLLLDLPSDSPAVDA